MRLIRSRILSIILASVASMVTGIPASAGDWAVIVGINRYPGVKEADGTTPLPLRGAENDAESVHNMLIELFAFPKEHVFLLKGAEATRANLERAIKEVARQSDSNDTFVFHFSGHGTRVADRRPLDESDDLDEALCLADTTGSGENLLIDDDLAMWMEDLPVGQITVILDCCHAGTGTKDSEDDLVARFLPLSIDTGLQAKSEESWRELRGTTKDGTQRLTAFFACQSDQQAYERRFPNVKSPAKGGQFTQALLDGIRDFTADADRNGKLTNQELLHFTQERLDKTFNETRSRRSERQEPLLETQFPDGALFGQTGGQE